MAHHQQTKALLLGRIHQQRQELSTQKWQWMYATSRYDRGWLRLMSLRKYLIAGSSLVALYNIRHPSRMVRWTKRILGIMGTVKLIRSTFQTR